MDRAWYMEGDAWALTQQRDEPERNVYFESIMAQSNGLLGIRAYDEEGNARRESIREGYYNGVFAGLGDEPTRILNGEFDWPCLQMVSLPELFRCGIVLGGEPFSLESGELQAFRRTLSLREGLLTRELTWRSPGGRRTRLRFRRFLSAATAALGLQEVELEALDWQGEATLDFGFATAVPTVFRCGNKAEPQIPQYHYTLLDGGEQEGVAFALLRTNATEHRVAVATALDRPPLQTVIADTGAVQQAVQLALQPNTPARVRRRFAVVSTRENAEPAEAALQTLAQCGDFAAELARHQAVWDARWDLADVRIDGAPWDQKVVRYSIFQTLQMMPPAGPSLNIPARALAYNRYRGLYFWDTEIFVLPFFTFLFPETAEALLRFRYDSLDGARDNARFKLHRLGALYAWMSDADTGRDNSIDGRVTFLQHQNADIAYAIDQYAQATGDREFMVAYGLPVLAETARFWIDHLEEDDNGRWHSVHAVGPDEDRGGGRDNGYTNLMARHNLQLAAQWAERLANRPTGVDPEEIGRWRETAAGIVIPTVPGSDVPLQDEYLLAKKTADLQAWRLREEPERWQVPADTDLKEYRIIKQADIVLAMLLLEHRFEPPTRAAAYDFYEPMTQHVSSLSYNTHAIVAARQGRVEQAYDYFQRAAALDLDDIKGATADGLHAAALGGCWQAVVFGFAGLEPLADTAAIRPHLPPTWQRLRFNVVIRGQKHEISIP